MASFWQTCMHKCSQKAAQEGKMLVWASRNICKSMEYVCKRTEISTKVCKMPPKLQNNVHRCVCGTHIVSKLMAKWWQRCVKYTHFARVTQNIPRRQSHVKYTHFLYPKAPESRKIHAF